MQSRAGITVSFRHGEIAAGAILLLFAVAIVWGSFEMPVGDAGAPGPAYFPRALGTLLALASVVLIARALRLRPGAGDGISLGNRDITVTLLALVVLGLIFEAAGYVLAATAFMLVLLRAFSRLGWLASLIVAVITAIATYALFVKLLGVILPAGPLPLP
jgi:putative tricarboxylic transport membrane protein